MALTRNNVALGTIPVPNPLDPSLYSFRGQLIIAVAAAFAAGDIIELGYLPAGCVVDEVILDTDALPGAGAAVSAGLLLANKTDLDLTASGGAAWLTAQVVATAGGFRSDSAGLRAASRMTKVDYNRPFGLKVTTAITSTTGVIGLTVRFRAV